MHSVVEQVTQRIAQRSLAGRRAYLQGIQRMLGRGPSSQRLGCANLAHTVAALPQRQQIQVLAERAPHLGVVTAYNDMLSAHQPYHAYPQLIAQHALRLGATAQVAGGVPAMCDGITQGQPGMELSLFSRDAIAMATAIALSHDVFDAALLLGVCDKIVPGLLIGALHFGHLPAVFMPAGPMTSGLSNSDKSAVRERYASGKASHEELLAAERAAYHGVGTCTFYGTANSNQMLLEAMGLHVPGAAFVHPHAPLREALNQEAVRLAIANAQTKGQANFTPIGVQVDERCIVNAMVALLATGGSTNHLIHWVAVAKAAGISIDWDDFDALSAVVPLLARVYPNGSADVNAFEAAGGPAFVIGELLAAGLMHERVATVAGPGLARYAQRPRLEGEALRWAACDEVPGAVQADRSQVDRLQVVRKASEPFAPTGGLRLLKGNLGRGVIKVSAVPAGNQRIKAKARLFESQSAFLAAFKAGALEGDAVVVLRFQGPQACGMPELHKLTAPLAVLQDKGFKVALLTDGRMSGASGKVPAAIHMCPEAACGGPLARLREGDLVELDAVAGRIEVFVSDHEWTQREPALPSSESQEEHGHGLGRELFAPWRRNVNSAEEGAITWGN